jgi:F0F1-type ATP synthase membrane subunit b/b'
MELHNVLRDMEQHVTNASRIPLTGKVMVDGDMILEFIDKIHATLPDELKQAQQVLSQSDKLLESVEIQGKRILTEARDQAAKLVTQEEIYKEALRQGNEIVHQAEKAADELQRDALLCSDDILQQLEHNLEKVIVSIKQNREDLRNYHNSANKR